MEEVTEYKEIASVLMDGGVLDEEACLLFKTLAGYRNRMVRFHNEISDEELFEICACQLSDISKMAAIIKDWTHRNPEVLDEKL